MTEDQAPKTDFFLKLPSEADMPELLAAFYRQDTITEVDDETGEETVVNVGDPYFVPYTKDYAIDVVGILRKPTGKMLSYPNGIQYPETAPLDGWHINIRLTGEAMRETVEAIDVTHGITPEAPRRVWL